jgi:hypothetical protein
MLDSVHLTPGKSLTSPAGSRKQQNYSPLSPQSPASEVNEGNGSSSRSSNGNGNGKGLLTNRRSTTSLALASISFPLPASWAAPLCSGFATYRFCLSENRLTTDPATQKKFVEYRVLARIDVQAVDSSSNSRQIETIQCSVWRRYSDFARLTKTISAAGYTKNLPFPAKQLFPGLGKRYQSPNFVKHRQALLQRWLWTILESHSAKLLSVQGNRAGEWRRRGSGGGGGGMNGDTETLMADVLLKRFLLPPSWPTAGGSGGGGGGGGRRSEVLFGGVGGGMDSNDGRRRITIV